MIEKMEAQGKPWYKSKTEVLNGAVMILSIVSIALSKNLIPIAPEIQVFCLAVLNAALRFITKEPVKIV